MPSYAPRSGPVAESISGAATIQAFRACQLAGYTPIEVPAFDVDDEIVAYTSPDSICAVTRRMFDGATKSIRISLYDFTAIFQNDWATAFRKLPAPNERQIEHGALKRGGFMRVVPADYREV